jgi:hypothetical protein
MLLSADNNKLQSRSGSLDSEIDEFDEKSDGCAPLSSRAGDFFFRVPIRESKLTGRLDLTP